MSSFNLAELSQEAVERIATGCLLGAPPRVEVALKRLQPHDFVCSRWNLVFLSATALRTTRSQATFTAEELAADALPGAAALRTALVTELCRCQDEAASIEVEVACQALTDRTDARLELIRVLQERNAARETGAQPTIVGSPDSSAIGVAVATANLASDSPEYKSHENEIDRVQVAVECGSAVRVGSPDSSAIGVAAATANLASDSPEHKSHENEIDRVQVAVECGSAVRVGSPDSSAIGVAVATANLASDSPEHKSHENEIDRVQVAVECGSAVRVGSPDSSAIGVAVATANLASDSPEHKSHENEIERVQVAVECGSATPIASYRGHPSEQNVCPNILTWSPEDLDQKIPPSEHLWHGLLAPRKVTLLYSRAKLGKSYLTFGLLSALWKGAAFLGRPTKELTPGAPPSVVYLTEEDADTLNLKLRHFAFPAGAPICFLPKRELPYAQFTFEESLRTGFELVRARGAKLLVLDTLSSWAGVEAGAEHFAARAEVLIKILKDGASASGAAVLVLHHSTKTGKELRGSSALEASPDALVRFTSPYEGSKLRTLTIKSRLVDERIKLIDFQENGPDYTVNLNGKECELKRLLEFIPPQPPGISVNELAHDTEMRRTWIYEALGMLQVQGLIVLKEGNGTRYFPARIWKIEPKQSA